MAGSSEGASIRAQHDYAIGGIQLKFPCKPYPTQMAMMAKIITALNRRENALLESPTGSGKSLALLCSSLAWLHSDKIKTENEWMKKELAAKQDDASMPCVCECHSHEGHPTSATPLQSAPPSATAPSLSCIGLNGNQPIPGPSHLAPPPSRDHTLAIPTTSSNQSVTGSTLSSGNPPIPLLPAMLLTTPTSNSILSDDKGIVAVSNKVADSANSKLTTTQSVSISDTTVGTSLESEVTKKKCDDSVCCFEKEKCSEASCGIEDGAKVVQSCSSSSKGSSGEHAESATVGKVKKEEGENKEEKEKEKGKEVIVLDDDDGDFKLPKKRFRTPATASSDEPTKKKRKGKQKGVKYEDECSDVDDPSLVANHHGHPTWRMEDRNELTCKKEPGVLSSAQATDSAVTGSSMSVSCPKCGCTPGSKDIHSGAHNIFNIDPAKDRKNRQQIFFGTRTHKQITQITHEMSKTAYSNTPMSILASREHTCIHPKVSKSRNKNDDCKKLRDYVDGVSCSLFHRVQQKLGSQCQLRQQYGYTDAWDIEDLVKLGKKVKACPYFALRGLKDDAEIIFCPYNYLIDPMIREQMLIDVEDKVIILDEAHNMEDSAREAASLSLTQVHITNVLEEITELVTIHSDDEVKEAYKLLQALCAAFVRWIEGTVTRIRPQGYEQSYGIWSGEDFLPILEKDLGLTAGSISLYENALKTIVDAAKEDKEESVMGEPLPPSLVVSSQALIKSILIVVGYLFKYGKRYLSDYRITLLKTTTMARPREPSRWMSKKRRSLGLEKVWTTSLNFWCLNPAVAFSDLTRARSIVLTSGTLSPMNSFSSELGVKFAIQLEASHVIPEAQTWVHSISHGPSGLSLIANYQNSETFQFQDEVGEVVLRVCKTVPHGVLCFFSSYKMMEKLTKRWQDTGAWSKIDEIKCIFSEPRSGHKEDFEDAISSFYKVVADSSSTMAENDYGKGHCNGALFLAVCRGKVSEGLDFADNNARAVITIGIPFPSIKDKQVELKREYNNEHCHKRGLLTGSEWYEIQAYRALNQALGRCIRHKKDWGALILIDERYSKGNHYTKGLSKWIRQRLKYQSDFNHSMRLLQTFTESMMVKDDSAQSNDQSTLLKSPSVSVSLGISLNSPDVHIRNQSIATSEQPKTPQVHLSNKCVFSKSSFLPGSPITRRAENTPQTSTPVASYKSAPQSLLQMHGNLTLLSTPGSSLTPANADATVNYGAAYDHSTVAMTNQSHQENQSEGEMCPPVSPKPNISLTNQSFTQAKFLYPGGVKLINVTPCVAETSLVAASTNKKEEASVIVVEESPPSSQGVAIAEEVCDPKSECKGLQSSEPIEVHIDNHTSQESINQIASSNTKVHTPNLSVKNLENTESPVLFDTPGCLGGNVLVKLQPNNIPSSSLCPDSKIDFDDDKTPPMSPELKAGDNVEPNQSDKSKCDITSNTPVVKNQEKNSVNVSCTEVDTSTHKKSSATSKKQQKSSSTLGQPRTRRSNTRMTLRKAESSKNCSLTDYFQKTPAKLPNQNDDDDDFVADKRTPKKQTTTEASVEAQETGVNIVCNCGNVLSMKSVAVEKVELKEALSSKYGSCISATVHSSKLWTHLKKSARSRAKTLQVIIVDVTELDCSSKTEDGAYNAVWDEKTMLCYSLLQCKCSKQVGVSIHSTSHDGTMQSLVGKAIIPQHEVSLRM